jgi:hypothetical protein
MENINIDPTKICKKRVNISISEGIHEYGKELARILKIDFSKLIETAIEHVVLIKNDEKGDE